MRAIRTRPGPLAAKRAQPLLIGFGLVAMAVSAARVPVARAEPAPSADEVAAKIDSSLKDHWDAEGITPARPAGEATFLRRATLDLAGRIPTPGELDRYLADPSGEERRRLVRRLVEGPEFALHFGNVLDRMIQGERAGDEEFLAWLRSELAAGRGWDALFRRMIVGPWKSEEQRPAARFLAERTRQLDVLTVDTTKAFFGVDISCAKCHDHPLVPDWSQAHFYGMASFLNRTYRAKRDGDRIVGEKPKGEVTYNTLLGGEETARMMFLTGETVEEPGEAEKKKLAEAKPEAAQDKHRPLYSRREQLVRLALEDESFLSRAIVNRVWAHFFGRGLVHPVDQLHSGNQPSVPGLLKWLAEDFSAHGYDLRRLAAAIASTRAYALSSRWERSEPLPAAGDFAVFRLRPLSRRQLAFSITMAAGEGVLERASDRADRRRRYLEIEERSGELRSTLDRRRDDFQSSTREAMFVSNHAAVARLLEPAEGNLTDRLAALADSREVVRTAYRTLLSRPPRERELAEMAEWLETRETDRSAACRELAWVLLASAEFRFNH